MSNRKINIISNIVLPIVVGIVTVSLFFLFKPEETTELFYINLVFSLVLEAVLFGYINLLYAKKQNFSTPLLAVFGVYAFYYIIIGLAWMLLYSLVLNHFFDWLKIYPAVLIVLTLLWVLLSALTAQTDSSYQPIAEKLKEDGQALNFYKQKITLLAGRYERLCNEKGLKYETNSSNRTIVDRLTGKISSLTPNVLKSETAVSQITAMLNKCEDIIDETESTTVENMQEIQKKMQRFVENAVAELDMLKNLTKR